MKIQKGQILKNKAGEESPILSIENGLVTINYNGQENKIDEDTLVLHIEAGEFELVESVEETTERQVTFLGITTTINPLKSRDELQKRAEKGLITPTAYYDTLRAIWNNMTSAEKQIEFVELTI